MNQFRSDYTNHEWMFRGQRCSEWTLSPTLERTFERYRIAPDEYSRIERGLLRHFKRQAHQYLNDIPPDSDWLEWTALMQHYGAPTRLLDWTYSFYVACFFAIQGASPDTEAAVWAFNYREFDRYLYDACHPLAKQLLRKDRNIKKPETIEAVLSESYPLVWSLEPFRREVRLYMQQGVFLVPSDLRQSYMKNVETLATAAGRPPLTKLILHLDLHFIREALSDLRRMNISHATLFPGLDGYSRNLTTLLGLGNYEVIQTDEGAPYPLAPDDPSSHSVIAIRSGLSTASTSD